MKRCNNCNVVLPTTAFHKDKHTSDGLVGCCKKCRKEKVPEITKICVACGSSFTTRNRECFFCSRYCSLSTHFYSLSGSKKKKAARAKVWHKVQLGEIKKPTVCERCKNVYPPTMIQAHHPDYDKPLDVLWLCRGCHTMVDSIPQEILCKD